MAERDKRRTGAAEEIEGQQATLQDASSDGADQSGPGTPPTGGPTWPEDPGSYIGHEPERAADTIPGGIRRDDDRVAGDASQVTGVAGADVRGQPEDEPEGHRQGSRVSDDDVREAGQDR